MAASQVAERLGLTASSEESAHALFAQFDTEGNGRISKHRLLRVLEELTPDLPAYQRDLVFREIDVNHDGEVDYKEFLSWGLAQSRKSLTLAERINVNRDAPEDALRTLFRKFDIDGNGMISKKELGTILRGMLPELSQADCDRIFRMADADRDGSVSYNEFLRMMFSGKASPDNRPTEITTQEVSSKLLGKRQMDSSTIYYSSDSVAWRFDDDGPAHLVGECIGDVTIRIETGKLRYTVDVPMLEVVLSGDKYYASDPFHNRVLQVLQTCFGRGERVWVNIIRTPERFVATGDGIHVNLI